MRLQENDFDSNDATEESPSAGSRSPSPVNSSESEGFDTSSGSEDFDANSEQFLGMSSLPTEVNQPAGQSNGALYTMILALRQQVTSLNNQIAELKQENQRLDGLFSQSRDKQSAFEAIVTQLKAEDVRLATRFQEFEKRLQVAQRTIEVEVERIVGLTPKLEQVEKGLSLESKKVDNLVDAVDVLTVAFKTHYHANQLSSSTITNGGPVSINASFMSSLPISNITSFSHWQLLRYLLGKPNNQKENQPLELKGSGSWSGFTNATPRVFKLPTEADENGQYSSKGKRQTRRI